MTVEKTIQGNPLDKHLLKLITEENFKYDPNGMHTVDTFSQLISLPEKIQKHYEFLLEHSDGTKGEHQDIEALLVEYWIDEGSFHYVFPFSHETVSVYDDFNSAYINELVLKMYRETFQVNPLDGSK